jgi:hypothetical protein
MTSDERRESQRFHRSRDRHRCVVGYHGLTAEWEFALAGDVYVDRNDENLHPAGDKLRPVSELLLQT